MSVIEKCKEIPMPQVYEEYTGKQGNYNKKLKCPFPEHDDINPSFKMYHNPGTHDSFYCFGCGKTGSNIDLVMNITGNKNVIEVAKDICNRFNIQYDDTLSKEKTITNPEIYNKLTRYCNCYQYFSGAFVIAMNNRGNDYFKNRGISEQIIKEYKLGYCSDQMKFNHPTKSDYVRDIGIIDKNNYFVFKERYIIPIKNQYGYIVGFAGRRANDNDCDLPKYINTTTTEFFKKSNFLYNFDVAKNAETIYVVEGYLDALSLITCGFKNVVALMGTLMSESQYELLKNKNIILALDNDDPGRAATKQIIVKYFSKDVEKINILNNFEYKDLNELLVNKGETTLKEALMHITNGVDFIKSPKKEPQIEKHKNWFFNFLKMIFKKNNKGEKQYD